MSNEGKRIGRLSQDDDRAFGKIAALFSGIWRIAERVIDALTVQIHDDDVRDAIVGDVERMRDMAEEGSKFTVGEIERRRRAARGDD